MLTELLTILLAKIKSGPSALAGAHSHVEWRDVAGRGNWIISGMVKADPVWHMRGCMERFTSFTSFTTGRRKTRAPRIAFGVAAAGAAMLLAACSSSSSSSSGGTTPAAGNSSSASGSADMTALTNAVNQAAAVPTFSTYAANYGGKIPSISNLAGKKIMIIPGVSALAACTEIAQADAAIATAAGMKPTIFENQGSTAEHNTAIENAIHQGYAAIDMGCAMDPSTSSPAIAQAQKAGLVVESYGATPQEATNAKITYNNVDPYALDAKIAADQAVEQHNGQPFNAIAITSNATGPATAIMEASLKAELAKICPGCTVSEVNVEVPDWQTQIASTVSSQLLQHPNVTVLFPDYAGMMTYVLAGIQTAHRGNNIKAYLNFSGGKHFVKLQTSGAGKAIVQSDIGGYPPWTGYLMFLQTARALEKMQPIPYDKAIGPDRVVTPDNAVEVLTTGGWGTDWVNGFRGLLGLPALSGSALTAAATLNGAMTGTP
jgi:ribose transport system substrate-binding protein